MSDRREPPARGLLGLDGPGALDGLMLDIGDDVGALVLLTDETLVGSEIEVSPLGREDVRTHAEVHPRRVGGDTVHAAVFVRLDGGSYCVWRADGGAWGFVQIEGGRVAELDLRFR